MDQERSLVGCWIDPIHCVGHSPSFLRPVGPRSPAERCTRGTARSQRFPSASTGNDIRRDGRSGLVRRCLQWRDQGTRIDPVPEQQAETETSNHPRYHRVIESRDPERQSKHREICHGRRSYNARRDRSATSLSVTTARSRRCPLLSPLSSPPPLARYRWMCGRQLSDRNGRRMQAGCKESIERERSLSLVK